MDPLVNLPKNKKDLAESLDRAIRTSSRIRNHHAIKWAVNHHYLQGARRFHTLNWERSGVQVGYEDGRGEVNFNWEHCLLQYQTEVGRLKQMDISPACEPVGTSLFGMRDAAVAQAVLTNKVQTMNLPSIHDGVCQFLPKQGTVGLTVWSFDFNDQKLDAIDKIPAWELVSIPDTPETLDDLQIIVRQRQVQYDWLKDQPGIKLLTKDDPALNARVRPIGSQRMSTGPEYGTVDQAAFGVDNPLDFKSPSDKPQSRKPGKGDPTEVVMVLLEECFVLGPNDTLAAYVVKVGKHIAREDRYFEKGEMVPMPIHIARYTPTDTFYGRAFLDRTIPINDQVQKMLESLFKNIQELDQFGFLCLPSNIGINKRDLKKTNKPRILWYHPDYSDPDNKPFDLKPTNAGAFPGQIAQLGTELQNMLSGQSEIFAGDAPSRTESQKALGFLYETNSIPLTVPAGEIEKAFAGCYRYLLWLLRKRGDLKEIQLSAVDESLAGIKLEPNGTMKLDKTNAIPEPWNVKIGIKDKMPTPKDLRKQELLQMLELQVIDQMTFIILNYKEELGFPVGNKAIWNQYQKAVFQNLVLFGDGESPGANIINPNFDNPEIQLYAMDEFTASAQFAMASSSVRDAFKMRKATYRQLLGLAPEQLPPVADAVAQEMAMMQQGAAVPAGGDVGF